MNLQELWETQLATIKDCLSKVNPSEVIAIGITNQRETIGLWNKAGQPLTPAISWQCKRTQSSVDSLKEHEQFINKTTGLTLNPYFSASKLQWLLSRNTQLKAQIEAGEVLAGTIDSWLLYKLTAGASHSTDASNASRTLLFDIHKLSWSPELLKLFEIPSQILPSVQASQGHFGVTAKEVLGHEIPIMALIGDQQAALYGHSCLNEGMAELTCGTGGFLLANLGHSATLRDGLLTSVAWQLQGEKPVYAQEASILSMGSMLEWLARVGLLEKTDNLDELLEKAKQNNEILVMPAVNGYGSPDWKRIQQASICNFSAQAASPEILKATLDGIACRVKEVANHISQLSELRIGGGISRSDYFCQFLADLLELKVLRASNIEATAWGAASLAHAHFTPGELKAKWQVEKAFTPSTNNFAKAHWEKWKAAFG